MISVTGMCVGKHVDIHSMQSTNYNIFITTVPSYSLAKLKKLLENCKYLMNIQV